MEPLAQLKDPAFRALAAFLVGDVPLKDALTKLAELACVTVPQCEMSAVTLLDGDAPASAVATDPAGSRLDATQYEVGRGPSLDAVRLAQVCLLDDTHADDRWPDFSQAAAAEDIRSVAAIPLIAADRVVGAMTLFSRKPGAFDGAALEIAGRIASQAALAVGASLAYWQTHGLMLHLEEALRTRPVIEQAKGIIMATEGCTPDEAWDMLRRASQRENRKLRDLAVEFVDRAVERAQHRRTDSADDGVV